MTDGTKRFDTFILLAEMRTGSNYLEANLNEIAGLTCYGEAFNPHFIGRKNGEDLFGVTLAMRDADPMLLVRKMRENTDGLAGYRYFHDHDPRVLDACLPDPRCAKIILTRNPLESYVSLKIAAQTGQWMLKDAKHQKTATIEFDPADFERHMAETQAFQLRLLNGLQVSGQTAFYLAYEDIGDLAVLNGLARFLGVTGTLLATSNLLKKQNPEEITEKVTNPAAMEQALARLDRFNLHRTPNFEPRRGALLPTFQAGVQAPLLYQPIRGTGQARISAWLAALDKAEVEALQDGFNHKTIRQWKKQNPGHLSFTVIRHPLARAHSAFCDYILTDALPEIRATLKRRYKVPLPEPERLHKYDVAAHREAFLAFLRVMKNYVAGQTSLRIDGAFATQSAVIQGFSQIQPPDLVLREAGLAEGLAYLAGQVGRTSLPLLPDRLAPFNLAEIYSGDLETAALEAYQRDYIGFGYGRWKAL